MKKILSIPTIVAMALITPVMVFAQDVYIDGVYYNLNGNSREAEVSYNTITNATYAGDVVIPEKITYNDITYTVTGIAKEAFATSDKLTSVTMPNTIKKIGEYAFCKCTSLTTISMPGSLQNVAIGAFSGCTGLTRVDITSLEDWYKISFEGFGNPLHCAHHLYVNGKELTELVIPDNVTSIGSYNFDGATSLNSVTIPATLKSIGEFAFNDCTGLTRVNISDLASWCEIDFGTSASSPLLFARHLYLNGDKITDVVIPDNVKRIGDSAFRNCPDLKSVVIAANVDSINELAFMECENIEMMRVESGNKTFDSRNNCNCIIKTTTNELIAGCNNSVIPDGVTKIYRNALSGCGIKNVTIPNSVTTVDEDAISYCSNLTSVTIGKSVTLLNNFAFCMCPNLSTVICYAEQVPGTGLCTFKQFENEKTWLPDATLYVPEKSIDAYKAADTWKEFAKILPLESIETGISSVQNSTNKSQSIYDLSGRRLSATQKGINIIGGKKYIK